MSLEVYATVKLLKVQVKKEYYTLQERNVK